MSLAYLVSGSRCPKSCLVWVPSPGASLKSNQMLAGCTHKLSATSALAHLEVGHHSSSKGHDWLEVASSFKVSLQVTLLQIRREKHNTYYVIKMACAYNPEDQKSKANLAGCIEDLRPA